MKEILAMGGSAQDLELLNDIDSESEIEGEEVTPSKPKSAKKTKASPAGDAEEVRQRKRKRCWKLYLHV